MAAAAAVPVRFLVIPIGLAATGWARQHHLGILNWVAAPNWLTVVLAFLLLDFTFYYWHRLLHQVPVLWRFHNVHHIDPDLDVSTALRFHFGEIALSLLFRVPQLVLIGCSPATFVIFETCFTAVAEFQHSNWRLPFRLERALNKILVTPRMHGIHHSLIPEETDSNYSTIFSLWDRLNGSFRMITEAHAVTIGVPAYRDPADRRILRLFLLPFQKQRSYWRS